MIYISISRAFYYLFVLWNVYLLDFLFIFIFSLFIYFLDCLFIRLFIDFHIYLFSCLFILHVYIDIYYLFTFVLFFILQIALKLIAFAQSI